MKAQCIHQDSGLCETCFGYEQRVSELETALTAANALIAEGADEAQEIVERLQSALQAERELSDGLAEALRIYGRHKGKTDENNLIHACHVRYEDGSKCRCGFDIALARHEERRKG